VPQYSLSPLPILLTGGVSGQIYQIRLWLFHQYQFNQEAPDKCLVTDITYERIHESWLYLAVVIGLGGQEQ